MTNDQTWGACQQQANEQLATCNAMLSTGMTLSFGIAVVAGVLTGSLATAVLTGRFKLEGYNSPNHMLRSISGAALMGIANAIIDVLIA